MFSAPAWRGHWGTKRGPDFPTLHQELKREGVTLQLLWEEYCEGLMAEQAYCVRYRDWRGRLKRSMRQFTGPERRCSSIIVGACVEVIDPATGEVREANIFVAVLGANAWNEGRMSTLGRGRTLL